MRYRMMLAMLMTLLLPGMSQAADSCTGALTSQQIHDCLATPGVTRPLSRGIKHGRGITVEGDQPPAQETTVNLMVNFEFNSAELSNDGMISLDALGKALTDPVLREAHYRISGHTDAVGSDFYNQRLSEARATAVRAYLARYHHLDPDNFEVVGYGKTQLYDPNDPTAAINRRVQVTKLTQ